MYGEKAKLMPQRPLHAAEFRYFVKDFDSNIVPQFYGFLWSPPHLVEKRSKSLEKACDELERLYAKHSGPYFFGDEFSMVSTPSLPHVPHHCSPVLSLTSSPLPPPPPRLEA